MDEPESEPLVPVLIILAAIVVAIVAAFWSK